MKDIEILQAKDIDKIKIEKVIDKKGGYVKDVRIHFPKSYKHETISFLDTGLINVIPDPIEQINDTVSLKMYGVLTEIEE